MKRAEVLRLLQQHQHEWKKKFGVKTLALFGSVARDEAGVESDVDILVEFEGPVTFDRYMGLKLFLEDLLGCSVDLATVRLLKPRIRSRVLEEAIYVS